MRAEPQDQPAPADGEPNVAHREPRAPLENAPSVSALTGPTSSRCVLAGGDSAGRQRALWWPLPAGCLSRKTVGFHANCCPVRGRHSRSQVRLPRRRGGEQGEILMLWQMASDLVGLATHRSDVLRSEARSDNLELVRSALRTGKAMCDGRMSAAGNPACCRRQVPAPRPRVNEKDPYWAQCPQGHPLYTLGPQRTPRELRRLPHFDQLVERAAATGAVGCYLCGSEWILPDYNPRARNMVWECKTCNAHMITGV